MRLREFKEPRQRIDEVAVVALAPYILALLAAGGAMVAGDPETAKNIDRWIKNNPSQANEFGKQIKQGQDAGALPKNPANVTNLAFPIVSALSNTWDWMTGGSTTGNKPAQPSDYKKDKNGMLVRKETAQEIQKKIGDIIASNTTTFDNQSNAQKALPSLKDGTIVTIGGKTYKVSPDAGGVASANKRGFVPYKDMGKVTGKPVTGQVDDIKDFSASPSTSAADDDYYSGASTTTQGNTVGMPSAKPKPSAGTTDKSGPSWLDRAGDAVSGVFNTVAGAVGGLFGSEDDVKTNIPPAQAPDINIGKDASNKGAAPVGTSTTTQGNTVGMPGDRDKITTKPIAPPVVKPGEIDKGGAGTGDVVRPGDTAGTGAEAGTTTDTTTGTKTDAKTDAKADAKADATATTATATPMLPPIAQLPGAFDYVDGVPDADVIYTGPGRPKKVVRLRTVQ